jgi:hypothetical protein
MNWLRPIGFFFFLMILLYGSAMIHADSQSAIVIFSKGDSANEQYLDNVGAGAPFWTPTKAQITELEKLIEPFLKSHPPADKRTVNFSTYGRQYYGLTKTGKQYIFLNAFCDPKSFDKDALRKRMIIVMDGGSCYFQVFFDPIKKEFSDLRYNGVA